jgi:DNA-binding transcriptional MocR family regulator
MIIEDAAYAFLADGRAHRHWPRLRPRPRSTCRAVQERRHRAAGRLRRRAGRLVPKLERAIRATTWNTPGVMTAIACGWLDDGTVARLEAEKRRDASARQVIAVEVLAGLPVRAPSGVLLRLAAAWARSARRPGGAALLRERISVSTAEPFATSAHVPHAIRLALGSVSMENLRDALVKVRRAVDEQGY